MLVKVGWGDLVIDIEKVVKLFQDIARTIKFEELDTGGYSLDLNKRGIFYLNREKHGYVRWANRWTCFEFIDFRIKTVKTQNGKVYTLRFKAIPWASDMVAVFPIRVFCPSFDKFLENYEFSTGKLLKLINGFIHITVQYEISGIRRTVKFSSEASSMMPQSLKKVVIGSEDSFVLLPPDYRFSEKGLAEVLSEIEEAGCDLQGLSLDLFLERFNKAIKTAYILALKHFWEKLN